MFISFITDNRVGLFIAIDLVRVEADYFPIADVDENNECFSHPFLRMSLFWLPHSSVIC